jgi:GntR family transcriptional regulator, transcriptional repressor for pyruvate dehydrogenase complex
LSAPFEFEPIRVEPAYRKVAAALRERILDRTLRDGDRLPPETELARQFGVHRSTVREALRELQSSGLLIRRSGSKRFAVTRPAPGVVAEGVSRALALHEVTYFDVWEALTILEPPIAEAAARRRTRENLARIHAAEQRFADDHANTARAVHHVAAFFRAVGEATHNRVLMLAQEPLLQLLEPSLAAMIDRVPQARSRIAAAQRRIRQALEQSNAEEAQTWMGRHIRDFRRGYELAGLALATHCVPPRAARARARARARAPAIMRGTTR